MPSIKCLCCFLVFPALALAAWDDPKPGEQVEQSLDLGNGQTIDYLFYLPEKYDSQSGDWPLMLFLHGRGESDGPLSVVATWGPPRWINLGEEYEYVVVSPQCPADQDWSDQQQIDNLVGLLDHIDSNYKINEGLVYLTGLSMGGHGTFTLALAHPDRFTALIPVSSWGDTSQASKLKDMPIWMFHGVSDTTVPIEDAYAMFNAIEMAGNNKINFTTLEWVGHDCWTAAYALPDIITWLDQQPSISKTSK